MKRTMKKMFSALVAVVMVAASAANVILAAPENEVPPQRTDGTITVHKYESKAVSNTPGKGELITDQAELDKLGKPMNGVGFTLYKIKDDFYFGDEDAIKNLDPAQIIANGDATVVKPEEMTAHHPTYGDGTIEFTNLTNGYYILSETMPPAGDYLPMKDAIISMPYGYSISGTEWNFDIHVYPKNVTDEEVVKDVENPKEHVQVGDIVDWSITGKFVSSDMRKGTEGNFTYGSMKFTDDLDTRLDYVENSDIVKGIVSSSETIDLVRGDDYTVTYDNSNGKNVVVWTLTNKGIDKLANASATKVKIDFSTAVNASALQGGENGNSGVIENDVEKEWTNVDGSGTETATPPEKPHVDLSAIVIDKVDTDDKDLRLNGAKFKISDSLENAKAGKFLDTTGNYTTDGTHIEVTTGDNPDTLDVVEEGYAIFPGIKVVAGQANKYYLVETKAADSKNGNDYVLRRDIIEVTLKTNVSKDVFQITNTKVGSDGEGPSFQLPNTGGMGTVLFIVVGLGLIGVAILILAKNKKSNKSGQ